MDLDEEAEEELARAAARAARGGARLKKRSIRCAANATKFTWGSQLSLARSAGEAPGVATSRGAGHRPKRSFTANGDNLYRASRSDRFVGPRTMQTRGAKRRFFTTIQVIDLTHDDDPPHQIGPVGQAAQSTQLRRALEETSARPTRHSDGLRAERYRGRPVGNAGRTPRERIASLATSIAETRSSQAPLSNEEQEILRIALTAPRRAILAYIAPARISLSVDDIKRLCKESWLNDEVINAYIALLNQRNDRLRQNPVGQKLDRKRVYCFNTFFFTRLTQGNKNEYDFGGVARWTKRANIDVLQLDLLFVPINLSNYHWILSIVDLKQRVFRYWDSMHGPDTGGVLNTLRRWLEDEIRDKCGEKVAAQVDVQSWRSDVNKGIPRQTDSGSCGVFTTLFAECLERRPPGDLTIDFSQKSIPQLRRRMQVDLLVGELPLR